MRRRHHQLRALTLIEVTVSLVILAVAITAGVEALGSFASGGRLWQERSTANELANTLMSEIDSLPFADPTGGSVIGCDTGENSSDRSTFDDIDDYDGWDSTPPKDKNNATMTAYDGYRQQVSVTLDTSLSTFTGTTLTAGAFKKITVTISKDGRTLAQLTTIRAQQSGMPGPH